MTQAQRQAEYKRNRKQIRVQQAKYYLGHLDEFKDRQLRQRYGDAFGLKEYRALLKRQGGGCAICGNPPGAGRSKKYLHVDHDHVTNEVRGLLCHHCNTAIGSLGDDPELLRNAVRYLTKKAG